MKYITTTFTILIFCIAFGFTVNAQSNKQKDRPLKIKSKTSLTSSALSGCVKNKQNAGIKVRVKVTFHSSGKVTETQLAEASGCKSFDKEALRVAKKTKFEPEIKNGEPISVTKFLEYEFYTY